MAMIFVFSGSFQSLYTIIKNKINDNKMKYQFAKADNSKLTYAELINLLKTKDKDFLKIFRSELNQVPSDLGQKGERKAYV
jgi:arsenate reductase-like glutaredoxin family protein